MMDIRPIRTEDDYNWALAEIAPYFEKEPEPGSPEGDRFDVLATLIEAYEDKHYPIEAPDPVEIINYAMEEMGHSRAELVELLGSPSRVSEILNRRRALTVGMIHKISSQWRIPAELLVRPYHLSERAGP